ncbi:MAG: hypothetical protein UY07_C0045G0002 [Parcubacteria group bacterium GW2011_GWA1_47_8]|nr:MAG: hypothetical protein UY07_C0045G0002 [Parcubacteria group bacterium GW2011_GWA1_47_8]KKW07993.1 MAG: hypothetical protein UY42_C0002G0042 [Parcubacteria group bacterium GW2011_GWA2_49_16]
MQARKFLIYAVVALALILGIGYAYLTLEDFVKGPQIVLTAPEAGFVATTSIISLRGHTARTNALSLNGAIIPLDLQGSFSEKLLLAEGYNIMTLVASDRYGRSHTKQIEVTLPPLFPIVKPSGGATTTPTTATTTAQ